MSLEDIAAETTKTKPTDFHWLRLAAPLLGMFFLIIGCYRRLFLFPDKPIDTLDYLLLFIAISYFLMFAWVEFALNAYKRQKRHEEMMASIRATKMTISLLDK